MIYWVVLVSWLLCISCTELAQPKRALSVDLCADDTIGFPIDENTYYECKVMFQFEDEGREYLFL